MTAEGTEAAVRGTRVMEQQTGGGQNLLI
jgi:hypothetical protein